MAMDLTVQTGALTDEAAQLESLKNELQNEITAMRSISASFLNMWEGESKQAFVNSVNQNMNLLNAFLNNIQKYSAALKEISTMYESAEKAAVQRATEKNG